MSTDLTPVSRLTELEAVIERTIRGFVELGLALKEIRDDKLYKEQFSTFEDYCVDRWNMHRAHAYRLIDAAETVVSFGDMPILPTKESHARALAKAPEKERKEIWEEVLVATNNKPTAEAITGIVEKRTVAEEPLDFDTLMASVEYEPTDDTPDREIIETSWKGTTSGPLYSRPKTWVKHTGPEWLKAIALETDTAHLQLADTYINEMIDLLVQVRREARRKYMTPSVFAETEREDEEKLS